MPRLDPIPSAGFYRPPELRAKELNRDADYYSAMGREDAARSMRNGSLAMAELAAILDSFAAQNRKEG